MNFKKILHKIRTESFTEKEKSITFEHLIRSWLLTDLHYNELEKVCLREDFPGCKDFGSTDSDIDLAPKTEIGNYWIIQCECYAADNVIDKFTVDSFLAILSHTFTNGALPQSQVFPIVCRFLPLLANKWTRAAVINKPLSSRMPNDWSCEQNELQYILDLLL